MLPVVWTAQAEDDLLKIVQFIGERNLFAAQSLGNALKESTWPLSAVAADGSRHVVDQPACNANA